jgi:hypothetical protein
MQSTIDAASLDPKISPHWQGELPLIGRRPGVRASVLQDDTQPIHDNLFRM